MDAIVINAIFKPKSDKVEEFFKELKEVQRASREEEGCVQYELHQGLEDDTFMLYEIWENETAFEEHITTDHYNHYRDQTADLIESREVYKFKKLD
ncbi:putative quinol monooxygenase [Pseudalkalibacillus sp. Hm43]|uniref:putative quinol monooxygenase n=1 Tax=Pseudalkalibacillus sp. Hm43 TaxID=3450742 RepID=UPI003F43E9B3